MADQNESLFQKDLIFVEEFADINSAFTQMAQRLFVKGLVKASYLDAIKLREQSYPTGIDLSVLGENLPNVAIPHTEQEHCLATRVIMIKLKQAIQVNNMMNPTQVLNNVKYLFMILNSSASEQANILGNIMAIVTNIDNIQALERAQTIDELYTVINKNHL